MNNINTLNSKLSFNERSIIISTIKNVRCIDSYILCGFQLKKITDTKKLELIQPGFKSIRWQSCDRNINFKHLN